MAYQQSITDRFWRKVDKNGPVPEHMPHLGPCWKWTGACKTRKNGTTSYGTIRSGKQGSAHAHRVSWEINVGAIPDDKPHVLHHCDNPRCVRPSHLWVGTHQDNMDDREAKGRRIPASGSAHGRHTRPECSARGERSGTAKLTDDIVRDIRRRRAAGESLIEIGLCYHIDRTHVWAICARKAWKHVE